MRRLGYMGTALALFVGVYMTFAVHGTDILRHIMLDADRPRRCTKNGYPGWCVPESSEYWWALLILGVVLLVAAIIMTALSFSSNIYGLERGRVIDKKWHKAYTQRGMVVGVEIGDSNIMVGQKLPDQHVPARYRLRLEDPARPSRKGWVDVSRWAYIRYDVGQDFVPTPPRRRR